MLMLTAATFPWTEAASTYVARARPSLRGVSSLAPVFAGLKEGGVAYAEQMIKSGTKTRRVDRLDHLEILQPHHQSPSHRPALFFVPPVTNVVIANHIAWKIKQAQDTTRSTSNMSALRRRVADVFTLDIPA